MPRLDVPQMPQDYANWSLERPRIDFRCRDCWWKIPIPRMTNGDRRIGKWAFYPWTKSCRSSFLRTRRRHIATMRMPPKIITRSPMLNNPS